MRAQDTYGASEALPAYLTCQHEIPMGVKASVSLEPGECALIHTGGMLPEGADSVVMVEYTQNAHHEEIEILRAAAPGENVLVVGEDVAEGEQVIAAGVRLRPAEIGGAVGAWNREPGSDSPAGCCSDLKRRRGHLP